MIHLSPETEAMAKKLAADKGVPIDQIIQQALMDMDKQPQENLLNSDEGKSVPPEIVAKRIAAIREFQAVIENLPILDPRSPKEIMDELNEL